MFNWNRFFKSYNARKELSKCCIWLSSCNLVFAYKNFVTFLACSPLLVLVMDVMTVKNVIELMNKKELEIPKKYRVQGRLKISPWFKLLHKNFFKKEVFYRRVLCLFVTLTTANDLVNLK